MGEIELATLTLTLNSFVQTQPMVHCNMPLEPHYNSEFKTGAGIEKRTKCMSYGQKTEPDLKSKSLSFLSLLYVYYLQYVQFQRPIFHSRMHKCLHLMVLHTYHTIRQPFSPKNMEKSQKNEI